MREGGHGRAQRIGYGGQFGAVSEEVVAQGRELHPAEAENGPVQRGTLQNDFVGPGRFGKMFPDLDRSNQRRPHSKRAGA